MATHVSSFVIIQEPRYNDFTRLKSPVATSSTCSRNDFSVRLILPLAERGVARRAVINLIDRIQSSRFWCADIYPTHLVESSDFILARNDRGQSWWIRCLHQDANTSQLVSLDNRYLQVDGDDTRKLVDSLYFPNISGKGHRVSVALKLQDSATQRQFDECHYRWIFNKIQIEVRSRLSSSGWSISRKSRWESALMYIITPKFTRVRSIILCMSKMQLFERSVEWI